ncbi:3-oxoacyl-[acyl-carrier-protein] reductase [Candidatus Velamenicoccus archaeovorus]|uniref:3-oxoacyl-[acyl-carrier-protein] reductase n=1 Tax=Velamenicoccus archaeovorus TaxID=1930593 RepID=A0A410P4S1_VELA1|nr:3-oxoacyl-[acyl-carrier-protein] reductase [Candidatus Velamenicoccus archaeovorus]QAT17207.1 3-oxoacyl-[acyl-carrier-protein] reductase [Candidatus Velamenicoccus archaeovorus]
MKLQGKVALVTGGARGIGREIAMLFAQEGADVVICDVNLESAQATQKEIEAKGVRSMSFSTDVTAFKEVEGMVNLVLDNFKHLDILVNNAGITKDNLLLRMSEEDWDKVLAVNLKGVFNCTKAVSKVMIKQRSGKIISIASIIGIMGNAGQANYAASKGGIISFTKSVARELASRNINANAVAPGFIQTAMTDKLSEEQRKAMLATIPLNRLGVPRDVACACLFLASSDADYITGQTIVVDGGMSM